MRWVRSYYFSTHHDTFRCHSIGIYMRHMLRHPMFHRPLYTGEMPTKDTHHEDNHSLSSSYVIIRHGEEILTYKVNIHIIPWYVIGHFFRALRFGDSYMDTKSLALRRGLWLCIHPRISLVVWCHSDNRHVFFPSCHIICTITITHGQLQRQIDYIQAMTDQHWLKIMPLCSSLSNISYLDMIHIRL